MQSPSEGFLGGSIQGREFWRGLRTGGESGARAFKEHCIKNKVDGENCNNDSSASSSKQSARNVKVDLYDGMRKALRCAFFSSPSHAYLLPFQNY